MAERRELVLKSYAMLLQYPGIANKNGSMPQQAEYKKLHRAYIKAYKALYEEVAAFSALPENFIGQAEPIIDKYIEEYAASPDNADKKEWLQVITDFISRFYEFMDEATEMFTEHQTLADETFHYLQKVAAAEDKQNEADDTSSEEYSPLMFELEHLATSLKVVDEAIKTTALHLDALIPLWEDIKSKIRA